MPDLVTIERCAVQAAQQGAEVIRRSLGHSVEVARKSSPTDVVTQTDLDAEGVIRDALLRSVGTSVGASAATAAGRSVAPAIFIGEESDSTSTAGELVWIVDPLDGTVNYTYGIPNVAVSVAAAVHGEVAVGVVVDVVRGEVFTARLGGGATLDRRPIRASSVGALDQALVATGFSYRAALRRAQGDVVRDLLPRCRDIRCMGSAALQLCWVGCGRLDAYYERDTKLWDYSAGALIAAEAGALVELPCPENDGLSIAAPPTVFSALRSLVR